MSTTILCHIKRAEIPFHIEEADVNIRSIEELCYYLQNNLPLVDLSFFGTKLVEWLDTELGAHQLVADLHRIVTEAPDPHLQDLVMPVMREASWLNAEEEQQMWERLRSLEEEPVASRMKQRADAYVRYGKLARAVRTYDMILKLRQTEKLGLSFSGSVWHNKGVAHARLFQMDEAIRCMAEASERMHTMQTLRSLLLCTWQGKGEEAFRAAADEKAVDPETRELLASEFRSAEFPEEPGDPFASLDDWIRKYRRETEL